MTSDNYPGDAAYSNLVQTVYGGVTSDSISMALHNGGATQSRTAVAQILVDRHNNRQNSGQAQTNADFLGTSFTVQEVVDALTFTKGYPSSVGWAQWAGNHSGTWFDENQQFTDNARWLSPVVEPTNDPQFDRDNAGQPRRYDFQKAEFLNSAGQVKRTGWNQSHHEVQYLWGWDPKEQGNENGRIGTHVGLPFTKQNTSVIVWFTPQEVFLECIVTSDAMRKRTSTGLKGFGQWTVT